MLDSLGDILFSAIAFITIWPFLSLTLPSILIIASIFILRVTNIIVGLYREKKLIMLHTKVNKLTGLLLFLFPLTLTFVSSFFSISLFSLFAFFWMNGFLKRIPFVVLITIIFIRLWSCVHSYTSSAYSGLLSGIIISPPVQQRNFAIVCVHSSLSDVRTIVITYLRYKLHNTLLVFCLKQSFFTEALNTRRMS